MRVHLHAVHTDALFWKRHFNRKISCDWKLPRRSLSLSKQTTCDCVHMVLSYDFSFKREYLLNVFLLICSQQKCNLYFHIIHIFQSAVLLFWTLQTLTTHCILPLPSPSPYAKSILIKTMTASHIPNTFQIYTFSLWDYVKMVLLFTYLHGYDKL